ncbi:aspartate racemase [Flavobacteriaceae bacterium UJ101]|nr:aspartate racemase [Flavobacteriaceae bacterium UJ101]
MNKMIGIVGGVGSYAGIDLIKKIYDNTDAKSDQEHLPVSMLSAPHKVMDRTKFLLGEIQENPGISIAEIITTLTQNGAKVIGIPCNTAHAPKIFNKIKDSISQDYQLLHLIEEVGNYIKNTHPSIKKVGVLCTNGTFMTNIYPEILSQFNIEVIHPSKEIQEVFVHPSIYDQNYGIKAFSNPVNDKAKQDLLFAASYLSRMGAEAIILGCTEIPLAINEEKIENSIVIDATNILAKALIRESQK